VSIQAVAWVFEHSDTRLAERLVLLSIANHARFHCPVCNDDHGERDRRCKRCGAPGLWEAYPGVKRLSDEARLAPRVVQSCLARLEATHVLERVINGAPDARKHGGHRTNLYRIHPWARGEAPVHPSTPDLGDDSPPGGVHASDTPDGPRGVAPERAGVSSDDIEGCRPTTPKPSVEPSMNQTPPSREPRGLAPDGDTAGGSTTDQLQPALTDVDRRQRIADACTILATRLAERSTGIARPDRWIAATAERLAGVHASAGHTLLVEHPDLPPGPLADLLERPPDAHAAAQRLRQRQAEEETHHRIRDTVAQPGNRARSAEEARRLREQLRNPRGQETA
jgi:hypothetical protein